MATVNNRLKKPQAFVINGIDAGGAMTATISCGYENIIQSPPDGLQAPMVDREVQFCRGTIVSQDWVHALELLTGTVGTLVFYERKSGTAEATGYVKHTITNPVIYQIALSLNKGGYATVTYNFECRAADETKGFKDMHAMTDDQSAPNYVSAARGGYRIETCKHDPGGVNELDVFHLTGFDIQIAMNLVRACNDGDVGYTCVDAELNGLAASGSIAFQDGVITSGALKCQDLLAAARGDLELQVTQSQAAADKVITVAGTQFINAGSSSDVSSPFTGYNADFLVTNDADTPLTLSGDNKILTIENAA
ncbi:MAG TPA: hypothetical protein HPP51_00820 [Planctomycetes bacterium]|nr:hypothetical protein [Planctomycetota bacterium]